jgi:hypothetical protein
VVNVRRVGRLGMLAVGLGVGAALIPSPGLASADSSSDWLASIDGLLAGSALPAASSGLNLAISYDGYSLFQDGNAIASTTVGQGGLAIAEGSGAYASATGGTGDYALADGANALAIAGGEPGDTGANYDTAIDIGDNDLPSSGARDGAYAGNSDLGGGSGTGANDTAIDIGNNTNGASGGGNEGAFAGGGGLGGVAGGGNNDTAIDVGNNSGLDDGADAVGGNSNYASETGTMTGYDEGVFAGFGGNDNTAISDASFTREFAGAYAEVGNDNYALNMGPENSFATAFEGNSNVAIVDDPFGSVASYADSGYGFNSDVAEVLGTQGTTAAVTADNVYDILTALGHSTGMF